MGEKYIRSSKNSYKIIKNSRVFAKVDTLEDAIFIRDLLVGKDWDIDNFTLEMHLSLDTYMVIAKIDEKLHLLGKFNTKPNDKLVEKLIKKIRRNPNNSKYGLNISRVYEIFMVKKQIAGDEYIFGLYDTLDGAKFTRNFLLDNNWNVNAFKNVEFCDESETFKIVEVIDERVYILASFESFDEAQSNIENSRKEFLNMIYKHKTGLANYPHLDALTDRIEYLEGAFQVKTTDDTWNFTSETTDPLNDIIFTLTPWQKIIYDASSESFTVDDLESSLERYRSKNFTQKIEKYLDELVELKLIEKIDGRKFKKL